MSTKGTKEMYANILTKPLQGSQFVYERESLTGWTNSVKEIKFWTSLFALSSVYTVVLRVRAVISTIVHPGGVLEILELGWNGSWCSYVYVLTCAVSGIVSWRIRSERTLFR